MNTRVEYDFARNLWRCCIYGDDWRWEFEITEQEVDVSSLPPPRLLAADMASWRLERDAEIARDNNDYWIAWIAKYKEWARQPSPLPLPGRDALEKIIELMRPELMRPVSVTEGLHVPQDNARGGDE